MHDACARRCARSSCQHFVKHVFSGLCYSIGRPRGFGPRGNAWSSAAISRSLERRDLPAAAFSAACSALDAFGIANTEACAREKAQRDLTRALPSCASAIVCNTCAALAVAATENHRGRTANRRRRRRRAARTTGSPRARSRAPADDRAPGCRRSCPRPRHRSSSSRSSASKLLTPQERIFPARDQFLERRDRVLQRIGAAPMQQIAVEMIGLQPLQRPLAGGDGAAPRGVARQHL